MCGIAGIYRLHPSGTAPPPPDTSIPDAWLDTLDAAIAHRGPDGHGRFRDRVFNDDGLHLDIALVHRRLSILDHEGGHQPMVVTGPINDSTCPFHGQTDTVAVAFNGFIDNHAQLREAARSGGYEFRSDHSDTEVLAVGMLTDRDHIFINIFGMWSAAVWSRRAGLLHLSRDTFGEKPLYITDLGNGVGAFANVRRALADLRRRTRAPAFTNDTPGAAVRMIATGGIHWKHCFQGIGQVAPGGIAIAPGAPSHCGFEPTDWSGHLSIGFLKGSPVNPINPLERIEKILDAAVQRRLDADVPVACLLSGGVDSSLVTFLARRHAPDITSICVRMPDAAYDESPVAARVAAIIGTRHITADVDPRPAEDLVRLIETLGFPLGDSSLLPTYWACKAARQHAKVVLTGDGGDELFVGYERYVADRHLRAAGTLGPVARVAAAALPQHNPKALATKAARFLRAAGGAGYADLVAIFPSDDLARLLSPEIARQALMPHTDESGRLTDLRDNLPNVLLRKTDHASMSAGVELRAPFLDRNLAQAVLRWPQEVLTPAGERKGLLRALARKYLPADIVDRPKSGFAVPIGEWFRTDFGGMKALLLDMLGSADPFPTSLIGAEIKRRFVTTMLDEHMHRRRDHSQRLYMLLVLAIWCRQETPP